MWQKIVTAIASVLVVSSIAAGAVPVGESLVGIDAATDNEPPMADAGLDQEVTRGATVLLDGTGSHDPDGEIRRYQWSIRTPNNEIVTPDCTDCARTEFAPSEVGEYRVTLTVTDDAGATQSDTLYVDVSPGTEPSISLSGPEEPTEGSTATYTATLDAGTAALDYVVWTVDGAEIANQSLSADQTSAETTKRFPNPDTRSVTATVYDVDGQSATDSVSVSVQQESETADPDPSPEDGSDTGTPGPETSNPESTIAEQHDPTVTGDAVVTGTEPLRGQYEVQLDASADVVDSVEWRNVTERVGTGLSLARTWEPRNHELYAVVTYVDGSENVATFSDGSTTVIADPKPNVSLGSLDRWGSISGSPSAVDEYENLASVRVEIDGETVASSTRNRPHAGYRQTVDFSYDDFVPGERYSVTVVATDARGQTTTVSRDVVPVKEPEIVRSEFVNGPVDSYHERIDPSRYAAHHVLEVDLNGVNPENVSVMVEAKGETIKVEDKSYSRSSEYNPKEDVISVDSFWAGGNPKYYKVESRFEAGYEGSYIMENEKSTFKITPSKPEFHLDVLNDGTKDYITKEHGIHVDASDSFDPDGTDLKYIWKHGAEPTKPDNTTAKFDAYELAEIIVEDQYKLRAMRNLSFLSYYMPGIESATTSTDGPYFPNETVRVQVETNAFHFSKPTYYDKFSLGLSVSHPDAEVLEWKTVEAPNSGHSDATEDAYRYRGIVEIPASELSSGSERPTITVYNEENERKSEQVSVPDVNVLLEDDTYLADATVRDFAYTVEKPEIDEVTVESNEKRDEYLENGYSVEEKQRQREYVLEKRVKVEDAKYSKRTQNFESKRLRNLFLRSQPDWYRDGTTTEEVTKTRTSTDWYSADTARSKSKWHDGDPWNGEYTGQSREVVVEPAKYQTQRQYRYDYEVEKTGTRTVTRTRRVRVPRTGTRTVTQCITRSRCYTTTTTYTYYTTETRTYTHSQTYTYTVTRTRTYWAPSKVARHHDATGKTRRVKIEDAEYETQHKIKQKEQYTDIVKRYAVARDELVQPAQYEWQATRSTTDHLSAQRAASNEDWRIGKSVAETEWVMRKQTGTNRFVTSQYHDESHIVETTATVIGDRVERYYHPETGEKVAKTRGRESEQKTFAGAWDREEILNEIANQEEINESAN